MSNLILVIICFILGYLLRRNSRFPSGSHLILNGFIIYVSLPSLILYHIHRLKFNSELFFAVLMPWILFFVSLLIFWGLYKLGKISRNVAGALVLTTGFGNTSFVGLPLISAHYGNDFLGLGILIDQLGTFLCLGTLGVVFAMYAKEGVFRFSSMGRMVFLFPPTQALVIAFILRGWEYPQWLEEVLLRLGDTLTPLALVSVGLQLNLREIKNRLNPLMAGLFMKLAIAPLLIYVLYKYAFGVEGSTLKIVVFESAMAPMVTSSILAMENQLEPDLVALVLGLGIVFSLGTSYIVFLLMGG